MYSASCKHAFGDVYIWGGMHSYEVEHTQNTFVYVCKVGSMALFLKAAISRPPHAFGDRSWEVLYKHCAHAFCIF